MPVDPRIFENLKLPTAREPLKMFEDIARLKALESEGQIRAADAQLRQRKAQQDEEHTRIVQTAWQQSGGDPVKAIKMVGEAGYGGLALEMQKELTGIQHQQQDIEFRPQEFQQRQQQIDQTGTAQIAAGEDRDLQRQALEAERLRQEANRTHDNATADAAAKSLADYREASLDLARRRLVAQQAGGGGAGSAAATKTQDAQDIVDAIIRGDSPPDLSRLYGLAGPVRAGLARAKFDLTRATEDWQATTRYLSTLNGPQQVRLGQAVRFTKEAVPLLRGLIKEWDSAGVPLLSYASLEAASSGAYGNKQQSLANRLKGQIAEMQSELATVYKGGNSSTDESLKLASAMLQGQWSKQSALDALTQIEKNLTFRENSIRNAAPIGARSDNPYAPNTSGTTTGTSKKVGRFTVTPE